jgi:hypothetical protein
MANNGAPVVEEEEVRIGDTMNFIKLCAVFFFR